jgi:hypothetical protein
MIMADKELAAALRQAQKTGPKQALRFAFFPSKGGKLIVSKQIDKRALDTAGKEMGCSPLTGKCFGAEDGTMVFNAKGKAPTEAQLNIIKNVAKKAAGLSIEPVGALDELEDGAAAAAGVNGAVADASGSSLRASVDFSKWIAAKQNGINQSKSLAAKVAGTKHALATGVLKEINSIIGFVNKLPNNPSPEEIDTLAASIRQHEEIAVAEKAPDHFAGKVDISKPMLDALQGLKG